MKKILCIGILMFSIFSTSCITANDLTGIWLPQEVFLAWQKGDDTENFKTIDVVLNNETYQSIWIYLEINLIATPKYLKYWGMKYIVKQIEKIGTKYRMTLCLLNQQEVKAEFEIEYITEDSIRIIMISMDDEFWESAQNSYFEPDRITKEQVYIRCPLKN